jgi:hypothetical protein
LSELELWHFSQEDQHLQVISLTRDTEHFDDYIVAANKKSGEYLFVGPRDQGQSMTTHQYARLVGDHIWSIACRVCSVNSKRTGRPVFLYRTVARSAA